MGINDLWIRNEDDMMRVCFWRLLLVRNGYILLSFRFSVILYFPSESTRN